MTANVTFTYAEKDDTLKFANAALRFPARAEIASKAGPDRDTASSGCCAAARRSPSPSRPGCRTQRHEIPKGPARRDALVTESATPGSSVPPAFRRPL